MTMIRAAVSAQINALGENEVEVIISTSALARDGHILEPSGCDLTNYRPIPSFSGSIIPMCRLDAPPT